MHDQDDGVHQETRRRSWGGVRLAALLASLALLGSGCASHLRKTQGTMDAYRAGQFEAAAASAAAVATDHEDGNRDRLILLLEHAQSARAAGDLESSEQAAAAAEEIVTPFLDDKAEFSVGDQTLSVLLNPAAADYFGTSSERIALCTMRAANAIDLGKPDQARVAFNRAFRWQQDAVDKNAKRIEAAQEKLKEHGTEKQGTDPTAGSSDPSFQKAMDEKYQVVKSMTGYADYTNPFSTHLHGVFLLTQAAPGDASKARTNFRKVQGMMGDEAGRQLLARDTALAEAAAAGRPVKPTTFVYYFTGVAPHREEWALRIPVPIPDGNQVRVILVAVALPDLQFNADHDESLLVKGGGQKEQTILLADVDSIVAREFDDALPLVVTQAFVSAAIKGAGQYVLQKEGGVLGGLIGAVATAATTQADLRTWRTLPKQVRYASLPTPGDGKVQITDGNGATLEVPVAAGKHNVIWVTSPATHSSPRVRSTVL